MKAIITLVVSVVVSSLCSVGEVIPQALTVDAPDTWKVEYQGDKGIQFYTVTRKEGDTALLMFSRWPVPGNANRIPEQIKMLAEGFLAQAKKSKDIKLKELKYEVEKIEGQQFSGNFVQFEIEGGVLQTMFMIGDGEAIWNGQFTGTKERWKEALSILTKLKDNDEQASADQPAAKPVDKAPVKGQPSTPTSKDSPR